MSRFVRAIIAYCLLLMATFAYAQQNECDLFSSEDIAFIRQAMQDNNLPISDAGIFADPITGGFYTGSKELQPAIKEKGVANIIFESKAQYGYFMRYLKEINNNPCSFKNRSVMYEGTKNKYTFHIEKIDTKYAISLLITNKKYFDSVGYPEHSYNYEFEKHNGKMVFTGLNPAG